MKKKNEIEQKLDEKEFESELQRHLSLENRKNDSKEAFLKDKNIYVIGAINFFGTLFFSLGFYILAKIAIKWYSLGYLGDFFLVLDPIVYGIALSLAIIAVVKKQSPLDRIIDVILR